MNQGVHPWRGQTITVLYGGQSNEREISLVTGEAIAEALQTAGYAVTLVDWSVEAIPLLSESVVVFVALHGGCGEGGELQGLLEMLALPYTGSGVLASALAMDKVRTKRMVESEEMPTAEWVVWSREATAAALEAGAVALPMALPFVVKPSQEGSSVGVSIVRDEADFPEALEVALRGRGEILIERFIDGIEASVAVLDGEALGVCEVQPAESFYDYEAKYSRDDTGYLIPSTLGEPLEAELRRLAAQCYEVLGCRGVVRVDFIVEQRERPMLLELNTIPGMTSTSLVPKIAASKGTSFEALVEMMLDGATLDTPVL